MSRFKNCARVAHAKLRTFFPKISLGQTQQLLASSLGHKTYASFLTSDASAFDSRAAFAVLASEAAMLRALDFGYEMNRDHWSLLVDEIGAKQVVGELELLESLDYAHWSVKYAFYEVQDPRIDALTRPHGTAEYGRQIIPAAIDYRKGAVDDEGLPVVRMSACLTGDIYVEPNAAYARLVALPVRVEFGLERIGQRLFSPPALLAIHQDGEPRHCDPDDVFDGGEVYGP
jgi:hypothetical protein